MPARVTILGMDVRLSADPDEVLAAAGPFLARRPVEHNLVLTLLHLRAANPEPGRYAWVEDGADVVGVLFQSPLDFFATTTPMERGAAEELVAAFVDVAPDLPGVNAEAATSAAFAGAWATLRRTPAEAVKALRLYRCGGLVPPRSAAGAPRPATTGDLDRLVEWTRAFQDETGTPAPVSASHGAARRMLEQRRPWLWIDADDQPAGLVGVSGPVGGVGRLGPVYTPPERRGRGIGSALTAHATKVLIDKGATPVLYTQLGNPTSNAIYQRLGYEPVSELVRYRFGAKVG